MKRQETEELYRNAMSKWGFTAQAMMAIEECSELTNALCKWNRSRVTEDDVITEIADVMIMCEQMACFFGEDNVEAEKDRKLRRLEERLNG